MNLLIDRPGKLLDADWIAGQILGTDDARARTCARRTVARSDVSQTSVCWVTLNEPSTTLL
jgi:hypothetical protein